jgi:hypothetical protein
MKAQSFFGGTRRTEGLAAIIREIVRIADPEKILLLSASFDYRLTENIFIKNPIEDYRGGQYDLLILTDGNEKKTLAEQEIMIYARLKDYKKLSLHLMNVHEFNEHVEAGEEFENFILLNAMLSYDKERIPLAFPKDLV